MTLKSYCEQTGLDLNAAVRKLREAGLKAGPEMTIRSIADTARVHPSEIRNLLEPRTQ